MSERNGIRAVLLLGFVLGTGFGLSIWWAVVLLQAVTA